MLLHLFEVDCHILLIFDAPQGVFNNDFLEEFAINNRLILALNLNFQVLVLDYANNLASSRTRWNLDLEIDSHNLLRPSIFISDTTIISAH